MQPGIDSVFRNVPVFCKRECLVSKKRRKAMSLLLKSPLALFQRFRLLSCTLALVCTGVALLMAAESDPETIRKQAIQNLNDGNFKDAFQGFEKLVLDAENTGDRLRSDLQQGVECLRRLQQDSGIDSFLKQAIETHPDDWRVYAEAARQLSQSQHYGFITAGEFSRGNQRGGGEFVDSTERDRAQGILWLNIARSKIPADEAGKEVSGFYRLFAEILSRNGDQDWLLQDLTDLKTLPDYGHSQGNMGFGGFGGMRGRRGFRGVQPQGAPVDEQGNPVYIQVPESFESARTDGERWRWCLAQMVEFDASTRNEARFIFAGFLQDQFGVQTLQQWGIMLPRQGDGQQKEDSQTWALSNLGENETIARLANGVKRFTLPDEFNHIKIYQEIANSSVSEPRAYQEQSLETLARIFENRQQYPRAAEYWKAAIERFPRPKDQDHRLRQLEQITNPWAQFEPVMSTNAGQGATVDFRFRNASGVEFEAYELKVPELLKDVQAYIEQKPPHIDWQQIQIDNIGYRVVQQNEKKYLGNKVASWSLKLDSRPNHFDRRITVTTPLQKAGAYLLIAKVADGNTTRIVLWLNDTAIVKKQLNNQVMYYVADATTGKPVERAKVEFFGWRQVFEQEKPSQRNTPRQRNTKILTTKFAENTNADGLILVQQKLANPEYQWLATARDESGRFAYLGFSGVWYANYQDLSYNEAKAYIITDRPVYRPDQTVQFKLWVREAKYDQEAGSRFAGKSFTVKINDPMGIEVSSQEMVADEFGGLTGEYQLPKQAALGQYSLYLQPQQIPATDGIPQRHLHGSIQFRVEEYKKPEFEVTVDAPEKPVALGETVTATVTAKYYYGAPVTKASVKLKVERSRHDARWYPADRWDWLYGNGYWWFSPDYNWYPGFRSWGCIAPFPSWFHWNQDPPELVFERDVTIGPDGTVKVDIDTSLAQALHGDQDHEYTITAEVVDSSRRTIVGSGKVLVSRDPFKIFAWTNRGYYNVGDTIDARFQARSLDGKGIAAAGKLQLLKITYAEGKPVETVAKEWDLATNAEGFAEQSLSASEAGQYRLSYKLPSGVEDQTIEGGYLFVIRGQGFDGSQFEFNDLELVLDQKHYAPGDKVKLLINTNRIGSSILLFIRPTNGIAKAAPQLLKLDGKSTLVELDVTQADMPNFFVEAVTINEGKVYDRVQEIMVPPESRVLNVEVIPSAETYLPGSQADVEVKVTDAAGKPVVGAVVLSVYDRAVEYISGGSNVEDIKEFFWKWRRTHSPNFESNLEKWAYQLLENGEFGMQNLGIFGGEVADRDAGQPVPAAAPAPAGAMMMRSRGAVNSEMEAMPQAAPMLADGEKSGLGGGMGGMGGFARGMEEPDFVQPAVRSNFADTAYWNGSLITNEAGLAKIQFNMPENLSSWKIRAWGMGAGTNVGETTRDVVTAKNLVVRLQAPRFFVETDEVVLSAVVHNNLKTDKQVSIELDLAGGTLELLPGTGLQSTIMIPAGGEHRVDWRVKAIQPGTAAVTMKALTDEESDAMTMSFPVIVHGILKTESFSGVIRPDADTGVVKFVVPEDRQVEQSRIEVRYSPTLAGAMVDALPYLVDYPYGCTEQTLNRFLPTVITQRILQNMGLDLKAIQDKRTNLNAQQIGDPAERAKQWKQFDRNPVFDTDEVVMMVKTGVQDLTAMQNDDGGWGWFSGSSERSYPHTTAVVVHGLQLAVKNDVALVDGVLQNGVGWLERYQNEQVVLLQEGERNDAERPRDRKFRKNAGNLDAMVYSVLVDANVANAEMQRFLYRDRNSLSLYAQALLGLALHESGAIAERDMVIRNLDQFVKVDEENQTAFLDLPNNNDWWYWYGNTLEANSQLLKLLTRVDVKNPKAAGLVKYLINNRKHGTYWNNTRDTAYCIEALAEYLVASGEGKPEMTVEVLLDGEVRQVIEISPEVLFSFENGFVLEGAAVTSGEHTLEIRRKPLNAGQQSVGPLYFNAYITNFTKEEMITAAGLEIKVGRKFYKLVQDKDATAAVSGSRGQVIDQSVVKYVRHELKNLDEVLSGDLVEIELEIDSKNDYEYVIFEDMKAAGMEPVDIQSGYTAGGLGAYVEFRDEKVAFFLRDLRRGKHSVSYRVRAEIPGQFSALPTKAQGMYAPELRANADEMKIRIEDIPETTSQEVSE